MPDPILHGVNSVTSTGLPDTFVVNADLTDMNGVRYTTDYASYPDDDFGINPLIRSWLNEHVGEHQILPEPPPAEAVPDSVTSRQFKMQLVISGLKSAVEAWVSEQSELVQVAYEYSGNFVRTEPMMQAGFTAMGFTEQQRNEFFTAASKI